MKLFYDHLIIDLDDVYAEIEHLEVDGKTRRRLIRIVDDTTHHTVLDTILSHLAKDKHEQFLDRFHRAPHDPEHLSFLKEHIADIEEKITAKVKKVKEKLLREFRNLGH
ncbi:MAG: hypothetical protein HYS86_04300 [Candidatus Chisholmbacteria bacterium]|nr:hypothetical protein [Candidatus Chisholmbacteria bacterium]